MSADTRNVDAAHDKRQLGQLMVDEGLITAEQLTHALGEQDRLGRPLGKLLVELGYVSHGAVANALAEQHGGLLKTEFGISAGLRAIPGGAVSEPEPETAAVVLEPGLAEALEAQLQTVLTQRNELVAQTVELQSRAELLETNLGLILGERNELAERVNALLAHLAAVEAPQQDDGASERIAALEAELKAAGASRDELETAVSLGAERIGELQQKLAEREAQPSPEPEPEPPVEAAHLLFVPSAAGYALAERPGPAPVSGAVLDLGGVDFVVSRVGRSPVGGGLRCAFLLQV